jgi:hypothetical protein
MPVKAFVELTGTLLKQIDTFSGPIEVQPLLQRLVRDSLQGQTHDWLKLCSI